MQDTKCGILLFCWNGTLAFAGIWGLISALSLQEKNMQEKIFLTAVKRCMITIGGKNNHEQTKRTSQICGY